MDKKSQKTLTLYREDIKEFIKLMKATDKKQAPLFNEMLSLYKEKQGEKMGGSR